MIIGGVRVAHLFYIFVLSYYVSLRSEFRVVMYVTIFGLSLSPVVCRRAHVLFMLFVFGWA